VPELELRLQDVRPDRAQLAAYESVCRFSPSETLPATFLHVLAFPLHMALMGDGRFPVAAVGLVHISNEITVHRRLGVDEVCELRVRATPLQPHPRGRTFTLSSEAHVGEELVWEERSTLLRRGADTGEGKGAGAGGRAGATEREQGSSSGEGQRAELPELARWQLDDDLGRRYSSVSGDRNPIHLHPYTARLFGFPRAIAHGMWTKAACLAGLQSDLPDAFTVAVDFRRPILLPSQVAFAALRQESGTTAFEVRGGGEDPSSIHLEGTVRA
jgi:acyl dehydratase